MGQSGDSARRYRTIVVDPPWDLEQLYGKGRWRGRPGGRKADFREIAYRTMSLDEIEALPVGDLAEADAHLYLWTTQGYLRHTFAVAEAWGFRPSYTLAWCKPPGGFVGGTFYPNLEFALFARRGTLAARQRVNGQWFTWPRGTHSAKPDAFLDMVEQVSPGPYAELFSRRARFGWHYPLGDQSLGGVAV